MYILRKTSLLNLILFLMFCMLEQSLQSGISFSANQKFTYASIAIIDIPSTIKSTNRTNWLNTPASITIIFERAANFTNVSSVALIGGLKIQNTQLGLSIFVDEYNTTRTQMTVNILTQNATNILKLTISYIYYQENSQYAGLIQFLQFKYIFNYGLGRYFSSSTSNFSLSGGFNQPMNITGDVRVIPILCGMVMLSSDFSLTYDFQMTGTIINSTMVRIIMSSKSAIPTIVGQVFVKVIVYNSDLLFSPSSHYYHLYSGAINSMNYNNTGIQITPFNTMVGLTSFSTSYSGTLSFDTLIDQSGITISSDQQTYFSFVFSYVTVYSNYCNYKTPYYEYQTKQCLSTCPGSAIADNTSLSCLCYLNNTSVNISYCLPQVVPPPSGPPSEPPSGNSALVGAIVGAIGGVIAIVIVTYLAKRYCPTSSTNTKGSNSIIQKEIFFYNNEIIIESPTKDKKQSHMSIGSLNKISNQAEFQFGRNENAINVEQIKMDIAKPIFYCKKQVKTT